MNHNAECKEKPETCNTFETILRKINSVKRGRKKFDSQIRKRILEIMEKNIVCIC